MIRFIVLLLASNYFMLSAKERAKFPFLLGKEAGSQLMTLTQFEEEFPEGMPVLVIAGTWGWNPWITGKNEGKVSIRGESINDSSSL